MIIILDIMNLTGIILSVIGGILILGVLVFVLMKFVFIKHSLDRQIKELERRYSYLDALMIGQDSQYVKRLEMISRTNLLYVDVYNDFYKRFKHVCEVDDKYAEGVIKQLKNLLQAKQYHQLKKALEEGKKAIATFEENATKLDLDLRKLIKPEEDSRHVALTLKEKLRSIKQTYYAHQVDLELTADTFNRIFDKLDRKFNDFESFIEGAEYDDANAILPTIDKVLTQVESILKELPELCIFITRILPDKIIALKNEAESLNVRNYPLHHLMLSKAFASYDERLDKIRCEVINLQIKNVRQEAEAIQEEIEKMHNQFQEEVDAKTFFETNCDNVYQKVLDLEKSFLRLCSILPEMNRVYKITKKADNDIIKLKNGINALGASKRSLDTFIHSSTHQPYSILKSKLETLMKDYEEVNEGVNNFKIYIESLKSGSEEAYSLIFSYFYRLKQCEKQIRDFGIKEYELTYKDRIDVCYDILNDIEAHIKVTPIDVEYVNEKVGELKETADYLFEDVNKDSNVLGLAESAIVYANRDRNHQSNVHQQLLIHERQFFNGEFEKTYHDVVTLLKSAHVEDNGNQ